MDVVLKSVVGDFNLCHPGTLAMSEDTFKCHDWKVGGNGFWHVAGKGQR